VSIVVHAQTGLLYMEGLLLEVVDEGVHKEVDEDGVGEHQEATQRVLPQKSHCCQGRRIQHSARTNPIRIGLRRPQADQAPSFS
jgi:hypothetical protein